MTQFHGIYSAIITPMNEDGSIDFVSLKSFVDFQLENHIDGLVVCGTTGESATLTHEERNEVIKKVITQVNHRIPVIVGTGTNNTQSSITYSKEAAQLGADGLLIVTPYYNKPTHIGMIKHVEAIAQSTKLPIILYNVPGRTVKDLTPAQVSDLAKIENVIGIKEATGDMNRVTQIQSLTKNDFLLFTGDDFTTLPFLALGGHGAISVASNIIPSQMHELYQLVTKGNIAEARTIHQKYYPLFEALFSESNPIPIKAALYHRGLIKSDTLRLPLYKMSEPLRNKMFEIMKRDM